MKTFRLISLCLLDGKKGHVEQKIVPIEDGLIINMENPQVWFIEAVVSKEYYPYFNSILEKNGNVLIDVVITSKENHPAAMITNVLSITELSEKVSVLLKGDLALKKDDLLADVLEDIVGEGVQGEKLLAEFSHRRANLSEFSERTLDELYQSLKEDGKYSLE
ncbi:YwpF-like family protein [Bacillus suaedae]|uniref:YwpF-like family protein n=1 Tax=Halalkalibacter suaedae TaxID=2822140 RepID=A0A941AP72_9BACI|nr:YwpF-like family protein [Bacillus suaedae]MBP3949843.1 YwpF-like family protein [Bacillus suaedae]